MKLGLCIGLFFLYLTGCRLILEQEWGPNLAQEATSPEPNLIDGNLGTKAAIPLRLTDLHKLSGYPPAEIVIQLKSVKEIRRIIVHSQDLKDFYTQCINDLKLDIIGLMCLPPNDADTENYFSEMRKLVLDNNFQHLSMGMSNDYLSAIDYGATFLRLGSKIFGARD